ncbi:type II toxin-antitoxin system VapC family toxin [soil metagenome]
MAEGIPVNLLLDTCALIALANGPLPPAFAQAFGLATQAFIPPVSAWEVTIKYKAGKLRLPKLPLTWFRSLCELYHLTELPLDTSIFCAAADLPLIHCDPFDRVLIATAQTHQLTLITSDQIIPTYPGVLTLW